MDMASNMTPSARFLSYEESYMNSQSILLRGFKRMEVSKDEAHAVSIELEGELSEAEGYLEAMEAESRSMVFVEKSKFEPRVGRYRGDYAGLVDKLAASINLAARRRAENPSSSHKTLVSSNSKLDNSTKVLNDSLATIAQTDNMGAQTIEDLEQQKRALESARDNVEDTQGVVGTAGRVLKEMANRALRHKIFLWTLVVVFAGLIGVVVYYGFEKKDK